jgi:hypothetical protein
MKLEELVLQCHIRFRLKANTGPQDVRHTSTLLVKRVDDRGSRWGHWSLVPSVSLSRPEIFEPDSYLEHETEDA